MSRHIDVFTRSGETCAARSRIGDSAVMDDEDEILAAELGKLGAKGGAIGAAMGAQLGQLATLGPAQAVVPRELRLPGGGFARMFKKPR